MVPRSSQLNECFWSRRPSIYKFLMSVVGFPTYHAISITEARLNVNYYMLDNSLKNKSKLSHFQTIKTAMLT